MSRSRPPSADAGNIATPDVPIPDEGGAADALPMSMTQSMMLSALPKDAKTALEKVDHGEGQKVQVRFQPMGNAPPLPTKQVVFQVTASVRFERVVGFLRKKLKLSPHDHLFCYVNQAFAPGLDEGVWGLFKCFKTRFGQEENLVVIYSTTPAFG